MSNSILLAGIIGPVLVILSSSEYLNYSIWKNVTATEVYLNGFILLIGGIIIVRLHNVWEAQWTVVITLVGWACILAGAIRMYFPSQKQPSKSKPMVFVLAILFIAGSFLSVKIYFLN